MLTGNGSFVPTTAVDCQQAYALREFSAGRPRVRLCTHRNAAQRNKGTPDQFARSRFPVFRRSGTLYTRTGLQHYVIPLGCRDSYLQQLGHGTRCDNTVTFLEPTEIQVFFFFNDVSYLFRNVYTALHTYKLL